MTPLHTEVWVIDDEEVNRLLARAYLERLGWQVREFANGHEVLRSLKLARPQAMLVDVRMPGLSGDDLVRQIRMQLTDTPVRIVGYTAHCLEETLQPILEAGFDQVLIKPVSFRQMAAALPLPAAGLKACEGPPEPTCPTDPLLKFLP